MKNLKHAPLILLIACVHLVLASVETRERTETKYENCQQSCATVKSQMRCENCIPQTLSENIEEMIFTQLSSNHLIAHGFCNTSWKNVKTVSIVSDLQLYIVEISNYSFDCLYAIRTLKLSMPYLTTIQSNSFYGLQNIRVLEFNECYRLRTSNITIGFSSEDIAPYLTSLTLNNIGTILDYGGVEFSQAFIDAIANRNVSELHLISTRVSFEDAKLINMEKLCSHLKLLNLSYTFVDISSIPRERCHSLQTVDFSQASFSQTPIQTEDEPVIIPKGILIIIDYDWMYFLSGVSVIFLNRILSPNHPIYIEDATLYVLFNNSIEEMHISGYYFQVFEVQFIFMPNGLKYLDLHDNKIERLSPKALRDLGHLEKLDLSRNKLGLNDVSSVLFQNNTRLEYVSLADNGLKKLPLQLFDMNEKLKTLDLSGNEITQLHINITKLVALESIDLRNNSINYLDQHSRGQIEMLLENKKRHIPRKDKNETELLVDLRDNPFSCQCVSMDFLHWFVGSSLFDSTRHQYHCEIDGSRVPINSEAIEIAQRDCDKLKRTLISILVPVAALGVLILLLAVVFKKFNERRRQQKFTDITGLIQGNRAGFKFLVFLSFASKDDSFVLSNVLQPLKETLKEVIQTDRDLVATGDLQFQLGRSIFAEAVERLEESAIVVIVLSKNYCESDYCKMEIEQARLMNKPIVIILKENVSENDMNTVIKSVFHHFTRVIFKCEGGTYRLLHDWRFICKSIISVAADVCMEKRTSGSFWRLSAGQCCARTRAENYFSQSSRDSYIMSQ